MGRGRDRGRGEQREREREVNRGYSCQVRFRKWVRTDMCSEYVHRISRKENIMKVELRDQVTRISASVSF